MNRAQITALVSEQVATIEDHRRRHAIYRLLVEPSATSRGWSYSPGLFECWTVARDEERGVELVYQIGAFGDPWGCLPIGAQDLGTDAQWFTTLDDAFIAAFWDGPLPPGYEVS